MSGHAQPADDSAGRVFQNGAVLENMGLQWRGKPLLDFPHAPFLPAIQPSPSTERTKKSAPDYGALF